MVSINKRDRDKYFKDAVERQHGEYCKGCGAIPHPSYAEIRPEYAKEGFSLNPFFIRSKDEHKRFLGLDLDHIDNDEDNNDPSNHQLLCRSCNKIKNPPGFIRIVPSERELTPEMKRGDKQEDRFRSWLNTECTVEHKVPFIRDDEAVYGGAEFLTNFSDGETISPVTTRRYLMKLTSGKGMYFWFKGFVGLKVNLPKLDEWFAEVEKRKQRKVNKIQELHEAYLKDFKNTKEDTEEG